MPIPPSPGAYGGTGPFEMGLTWALSIIATIVVCTRAYVALTMLDRPGWDLFWGCVAYVTCLSSQIAQTVAVAYGVGNHIWFLDKNDILQARKWDWIGRILGIFAATFGKNIVIALLLRIQGPTHKHKSWILHFIWVTNSILAVLIVLVLCLKCKPIALWWTDSLPGDCDVISSSVTKAIGLFQGSWMAASDGALAIYPIFIFWGLNLSWKRRAALCGLMSGGLIAGVCAAIKTVQVQLAYVSDDITYSIYPLLVTTLVECWMILILACLPALRTLFVKAFRETRATLSHSSAAYDRTALAHPQQGSYGSVQLDQLPRGPRIRMDTRRKVQRDVTALDNDSEEEILPRQAPSVYVVTQAVHGEEEQGEAPPGITIVRDYDVKYESGFAKT
ncbi:hypothetical protein LTR36_007566 [Oleoguttula mirabilis]|uniref:Rhodopsin domain-containing protein n=1 Tax=Oleoguttula mirabilis TaxID=1507867 RepID=A0AAV9JU50_9PEZI|nr:hypothetical protein LTR36_007566 [Oleoguttula mirabilis]